MASNTETMSDPSDDEDLDDPLLRRFAVAPPIALGQPRLPEGAVVGQSYVVHRMLGAGSMGVVYEATDSVLSRRVALKVHEIGRSDRAARLWREARAMARLSHPNVVTVFEVGVDGSRGYIAMELVEGTNARVWRDAASHTWDQVLDVYRQAGVGLAAAHEVGIVHRDFKPDNVLIGTDGRVRVADFGIALPLAHPVDASVESGSARDDATRTGLTMGTPAYMAPEQARRELVDARSDQYSFCVALHEALHGARPSLREGTTDPTGRDGAPASTFSADGVAVPAWISAVLERGLASDPSARHPSMHSLVAALDPAPHRRRRAWWSVLVGGSLAGLVLLRLGGWLATDASAPCRDAGAAIDDTWSSAHADAMREAFVAAAPTVADATARVVVPALDEWATSWRDGAHEACEATRVRGEQSEQRLDLRMDCLGRARQRLVAVVDLLGHADASAMVRAEAITRSLPDVQMCARSDASIDVDPVASGQEDEHARLSTALDRAIADTAAGRQAAAKSALDAAIVEVDAAGFQRLSAEARRVRAVVQLDMGHRTEAIDDAATAVELTVRFADRDATARAMIELARATGRATQGFDEATRWLAAAESLADELEWTPRRREDLLEARLEIDYFGEKHDEVERVAAEILREVSEDSSVRIRAMSLLARTYEFRGRFAEALALHDEALALVERTRGPEHPQIAMVLGNRVRALEMLSRGDEARRSLDRVLAIRRAVFGPDAPVVGEAYRQIGDADNQAGDHDAAVEHYEQSLAIHRRAADDVGLFFVLGNYGGLRKDMGDVAEAARLLDEALVHGERAFGPRAQRIAQLLVNRSDVSVAEGNFSAAVAQLERALSIFEVELAADDMHIGMVRMGLGRAYVETGRFDDGLAQFEDAARIVANKLPPQHPERVALVRTHAELLETAHRPEAAIERLQEAAVLADQILPADHAERIGTWTMLSERLSAAGRRKEAMEARARAQPASP
jgi:eukaryotic-like serine/threonine-protein kinase